MSKFISHSDMMKKLHGEMVQKTFEIDLSEIEGNDRLLW